MRTKLYFLGTGSAVPINRGLPCIALKYDGNTYLLDAGEGCQARLLRTGLGVVKIKAIFITHLHGDHFLGLFGMLQSMHMLGRKTELVIVAPKELRQVLSLLLKSVGSIKFPVEFIETKPYERIYADTLIEVTPFNVDHGIEAYGYIIRLKNGKTIVYTGDTRPSKNVIEASRNATILIHESTFDSSMAMQAYEQGHSTAADAAMIACKASVKHLILTHISARYDDELTLYYDAVRFFKNTIVAKDYMVFVV